MYSTILVPMKLWQDTGASVMAEVETLTEQAQPTFEQSKCDLIENPDQNEQFIP